LIASPSTGVNTVTGEGLAKALTGAHVVLDLANSPSFEDKAVMAFFEASGRNLLAAETIVGVGHHVALSVVGTERLLDSGYFRAKMAQEKLIEASGIPYTIVRATQFFEFLGAIAHSGTTGDAIRLSTAQFQPIASGDVAAAVTDAALAEPLNGMFEAAGPERVGLADMVQRYLVAMKDPRKVIPDADASYFGVKVNDQSLTPGENPRIGKTGFDAWFKSQAAA
jgi:uncharacterized protein YbjT (DUF2867 family)